MTSKSIGGVLKSLRRGCKLNAFAHISLQLLHCYLEQFGLMIRQRPDWVCLDCTISPEFDRYSKIFNTELNRNLLASRYTWEIQIRFFDDATLTIGGFQYRAYESSFISTWSDRKDMWTNLKPAYAIQVVADPAPAFACTISSPPNCTPICMSVQMSACGDGISYGSSLHYALQQQVSSTPLDQGDSEYAR